MGGAVMLARGSGPFAVDVVGYARELGIRGYTARTLEDPSELGRGVGPLDGQRRPVAGGPDA
jgi:hypothetical protein